MVLISLNRRTPLHAEAEEDALWQRGIKVLPSQRRSRSVGRWDTECMKTLPSEEAHAPSGSSPLAQRRSRSSAIKDVTDPNAQPWHEPKVLEDRFGVAVRSPVKVPADVIEEWYGVQKTLDSAPQRHTHHPTTWHSENLKVLPTDPSAGRKLFGRTPDYWHSGLFKTLPDKQYRAPQVVWHSIPKEEGSSTPPTALPYRGNWAEENFKVLGEDDRKPRGSTGPVSRSVPEPEADTNVPVPCWGGPVKLLPNQPTRFYHSSGWLAENRKVMESVAGESRGAGAAAAAAAAGEKKIVIQNTGWDSGLFKSIGQEPPRTYQIKDDWFVGSRKSLAQADKSAKASRTPKLAATPGWNSGLKVVPAPPPDVIRAKQAQAVRSFWHVENRKTLPRYYTSSASARKEYRRHVLEPRRQDMQQFHQQRIYAAEDVF